MIVVPESGKADLVELQKQLKVEKLPSVVVSNTYDVEFDKYLEDESVIYPHDKFNYFEL